jgi:hypothetical protein
VTVGLVRGLHRRLGARKRSGGGIQRRCGSGCVGWAGTPSPDHDLARWTAPQTGQIAEEYSHGPCQEQPSSVPRFVGAGTGGLAARSGPARGRQPDVAGDAPGDGGSPWWSRNECRAGCSATLNSLMIRECQQINRSRYQPSAETPSTFNEGQTSSISRISTNHRVPPAVSSISTSRTGLSRHSGRFALTLRRCRRRVWSSPLSSLRPSAG